jgi:hypothetical protein
MFSSRLFAFLGIAPMFFALACSGSPDSGSSDSTEDELRSQICGGIAGIACPTGFSCDMGAGPMHPDQSGHCKKDPTPKTCGGIAGLACPEGYACEMAAPHFADQSGTCQKVAATCGGFAGLTCPKGFVCDMGSGPVHPDQAGTCVKGAQ